MRLSFLYISNLGNPESSPPFAGDLRTTQLGWSLIVKFPVVIKSLTLWSGVGAGFLSTLMFDQNGDGINDRDPNALLTDIYAVITLGAELKIAKFLTIGPSFTLNYDLTPSQYPYEPVGTTHTQLFLQFSVTAGFILYSP